MMQTEKKRKKRKKRKREKEKKKKGKKEISPKNISLQKEDNNSYFARFSSHISLEAPQNTIFL